MKFKLHPNSIQIIMQNLKQKNEMNSLIRLKLCLALSDVTAFTPLPSTAACPTPSQPYFESTDSEEAKSSMNSTHGHHSHRAHADSFSLADASSHPWFHGTRAEGTASHHFYVSLSPHPRAALALPIKRARCLFTHRTPPQFHHGKSHHRYPLTAPSSNFLARQHVLASQSTK
jgi:hypothetical protein